MQLFSLAAVGLLALTVVQAKDMATLHLRVYNGGASDWGACTGNLKCSNPTSVCVKYSQYYAQCKPKTLPQGELCGQNDGTNVWKYDRCPSNQQCKAVGTDFRCSNKSHRHKKDASCTITKESQCDGQNWTGSTCCADPSYECRWSDDGQNVKRCQKIADDNSDSKDVVIVDDDSDYSDSEDVVVIDDSGSEDYSTYVDDWGNCTEDDVGCSNPTSACVQYSDYYAQCKPETLPSGELCGQDDGTNVWKYDHCPSGETCTAEGSDYRCKA